PRSRSKSEPIPSSYNFVKELSVAPVIRLQLNIVKTSKLISFSIPKSLIKLHLFRFISERVVTPACSSKPESVIFLQPLNPNFSNLIKLDKLRKPKSVIRVH